VPNYVDKVLPFVDRFGQRSLTDLRRGVEGTFREEIKRTL
jgi:hypothetical protein